MKAWAMGKRRLNTRETKIVPRMITTGELGTAVLQAQKANSPCWSSETQHKDILRLPSQRSHFPFILSFEPDKVCMSQNQVRTCKWFPDMIYEVPALSSKYCSLDHPRIGSQAFPQKFVLFCFLFFCTPQSWLLTTVSPEGETSEKVVPSRHVSVDWTIPGLTTLQLPKFPGYYLPRKDSLKTVKQIKPEFYSEAMFISSSGTIHLNTFTYLSSFVFPKSFNSSFILTHVSNISDRI